MGWKLKKKNANFNTLNKKNYFGWLIIFFGKFGNIPAWLSLQLDSVHVSLKKGERKLSFLARCLQYSSLDLSFFCFFFLFFYIPNEKNCTFSSGQVVLIIQRYF